MIPYLVVATEYAFSCHGTCPTCVLTSEERATTRPASTPDLLGRGLAAVAQETGPVGTLALGIGRGNVLMLPNSSVDDIVAIGALGHRHFDAQTILLEISTSLVGRLDPQIERAQTIVDACSGADLDARFVVVGNTALSSAKYWNNLDRFLTSMAAARGGGDGSGDILQLALSSTQLPDLDTIGALLARHKSPVNLVWAPAFDTGAGDEQTLQQLGDWLAAFHDMAVANDLDCSLVTRSRNAFLSAPSALGDLPELVEGSTRSVAYVGTDGHHHRGYFSILAEMDPIRFDPLAARDAEGRATIVTSPLDEIRTLLRNPACKRCPFVKECVTGGTHRLGLMTLRRHPAGTTTCPSGMQTSFARVAASDFPLEISA